MKAVIEARGGEGRLGSVVVTPPLFFEGGEASSGDVITIGC